MKPAELYTDRFSQLSADEKAQLRTFISSGVYEKYLRAIAAFKPSANCGSTGSGTRDAFSNERASARLSELKGWEQHEAALYAVLNEPEKIIQEPETEYPDAGLMLSEPPPLKVKRQRKSA